MSTLMDIIIDIENRLGWSPPEGNEIWKGRAAEHRKLTIAMARMNYTERDLRLAIAWCVRRQQPINNPVELIGYVLKARELTADVAILNQLDLSIRAAIAWENERADEVTGAWISRLVRSFGPARADTLVEWRGAGRGE